MGLPLDERPKQRPMLKTEESGNVVLASYPDLRSPPPTSTIVPIPGNPPSKSGEAAVHKGILRSKTKISIAALAAIIAVVVTLALFNQPQQMVPNNKKALYDIDYAYLGQSNYIQAF